LPPYGLALDDQENLYIASSNRLLRVDKADGVVRVVAGSADDKSGYSGDGGPATAALLNGVTGVGRDAAGSIFVSDSGNNRVCKITPEGEITTVG